MQKLKLLALLSLAIVLLALINSSNESSHREKIKLSFLYDLQQLKIQLNELKTAAAQGASTTYITEQFNDARRLFKRTEAILAYYDDTYYNQLNGPNLVKTDRTSTQYQDIEPHGFQVIEELLEDGSVENRNTIVTECLEMCRVIDRITNDRDRFGFYDREVLESMQQEVIRINALGLTGFDSPVLKRSLPETASALEALAENLELFTIITKNPGQRKQLEITIEMAGKAAKALEDQNFNEFDRLTFIKSNLDPLYKNLVKLQQDLGVETYSQSFGNKGVYTEEADGMYAENLVNRFFFRLT